ncbi:MAG: LCP family protein [Anaerolineae bacterium]
MVRGSRSAGRKQGAPVIVTAILLTLLIAIGIAVVLFVVSWVRASFATPGITPSLPENTQPSENVSYSFGQLLPTWSGKDRVTVLLLGVDERSQETGPWRTDTMMLLTIDPPTKQAGILSIPRDLWVPIPGHKDGRINTAHFLGDLYGYPGGGPALAVETVEYNFGIPVNYYVRVNFEAFVTLVNRIGGIDVYVEETINDPLYPDHNYGYDPLYIEEGWHHFDGEMALKYARTRHASNDFDRARRQQQVMMAILDRVTTYELLPDLARNASGIYRTLESSVATDIALDQMLALANLAVDVKKEEVRSAVIDQTCTEPYVTPDGAQVLIPMRDCMREIRDYVFVATPRTEAGQDATAVPLSTPTPEIASIAVLNGTTQAGLAGSTADYLRTHGLTIDRVANADRQDYASTLIVLNHDKPQTVAKLLKALELPGTATVQGDDPASPYDIVVVLGIDFEVPEP